MELFADQREAAFRRAQPLAVRMRPRDLAEFVGQQHFIGEGKLLRRLIESDRLQSAIFHGPPGTGKTTLARLIAAHTQAAFESLHAADAGVRDVRRIIEEARDRLETRDQRTVLFLDEIHRFNRAQQDSLLRDVEEGVLILVGATTENPFFAVNGPLLSRGHLFEFQPFSADDLQLLLRRALSDQDRGLGAHDASIDDDALRFLIEMADGDARRALTSLEVAVLSQADGDQPPRITIDIARDSVQRRQTIHDPTGDSHYDIASALIKSMRGSDPDAAVYWLARMLEGGEDPMFIARRIAISASEDVGNADPRAIMIAAAAAQITQLIGLPECKYALAQAAIYVACAPKSDACNRAISEAQDDVRSKPLLPVPGYLRDRSYAGATRLNRGGGYRNPHHFPNALVEQDYLGEPRTYYNPFDRGDEKRLAERLRFLRSLKQQPAPDQHQS